MPTVNVDSSPATMRMRIGGNVMEFRIKPWTLCVVFALTLFAFFALSGDHSDHRHDDDELYHRIINNQLLQAMKQNDPKAEPPNIEKPLQNILRGAIVGPAAIARLPSDNAVPVAPLDEVVQPASLPRMAMHAALTKPGGRARIMKLQQRLLAGQSRPTDKAYNINVTRSDSISLDRHIDDTRPAVCRRQPYERDTLPRATVIIPFYNEALSMLLRTVHSVLNRSPDSLLDEVILVDDASTHEHLQAPMTRYLGQLAKVRVLRNARREGLIVSRLRGSAIAKAPVIIFLDAHTECNEGWLEPLLWELVKHPNSVIQPFVDGIDAQSIEYTSPPTLYKGSFSWDLRYTWLRLSDHESARALETGYPYFSPTLVGCAIAVRKEYFTRIGQFDTGMRVWGGENIELGFRTWMCGGRVVTVICSRVGHVFKDFPYKFDGDREVIVEKNLMRVADVWMDDAKKYFYAATRTYDFKRVEFTAEERATLQTRHKLRESLACKSFDWYLQTIIPEVTPPPMDAVYYGEIMNLRTRACFEAMPDYYIGVTYMCYEHKIIPRNNFELTRTGELRLNNRCVQIDDGMPTLRVRECQPPAAAAGGAGRPRASRQLAAVWSLKNHGRTWGRLQVSARLPDGTTRVWCVMQVTNAVTPHRRDQMPQLAPCDEKNDFQLWSFTYKFSFDQVPADIMRA